MLRWNHRSITSRKHFTALRKPRRGRLD